MGSIMQHKRLGTLFSTVVCLIVFTAASCTSAEVSSSQAPPQATNMAQVANPCAAKAANPCAAQVANPCAAKAANPCAAKNPCAAAAPVDPKLVTRPARTKLFAGAHAQLAKEGERLWNDRSLGTSGLACQTCHMNHANLNPTFAKAYPHQVAMPLQRAGLQQVRLDEMVQFCMVVPMASKPLPWKSRQLAALTAYAQDVQKDFIKTAAANPCAAKLKATNPCNPCAAKAANPCAAKNPCAVQNPCATKATNPCAVKNPCNPCATKAKNPCAGKQ